MTVSNCTFEGVPVEVKKVILEYMTAKKLLGVGIYFGRDAFIILRSYSVEKRVLIMIRS